eukprot:9097143-Pyramimonas_sp.AAC.1
MEPGHSDCPGSETLQRRHQRLPSGPYQSCSRIVRTGRTGPNARGRLGNDERRSPTQSRLFVAVPTVPSQCATRSTKADDLRRLFLASSGTRTLAVECLAHTSA